MQCREIRERIATAGSSTDFEALLASCREHLADCDDCRELIRSHRLYANAWTELASVDAGVLPLSVLKTRTEAILRSHHVALRRQRAWVRPVVASAVAIAAVFIAMLPVPVSRTVGYEVLFANVRPELANDDEPVCELLNEIGLIEASVDAQGCDTTCQLLVFDLKDRGEVAMAVSALEKVHGKDMSAKIIPVEVVERRSIIGRANQRLTHQ